MESGTFRDEDKKKKRNYTYDKEAVAYNHLSRQFYM